MQNVSSWYIFDKFRMWNFVCTKNQPIYIFWDIQFMTHLLLVLKYVSSENLLKSSLIAPCIILARNMKTTWRSLFIIEIWLRSECGSWDSSLKWNLKPYLFTQLSLLKNVLFWRHCMLKQNIWEGLFKASYED